ncbi:MAG: hypothetical protein JMN25_17320 [gamma proteobacterium endosymbiont of Lamellibrachia anaximandri]|nr:hypothetical protein [gamma proteobacterium endosymbiont of Lamellibrachia anaximandri]
MRLVCPTCGATGSLEMFLNDAAGRKAIQAALQLPSPLSKQVMAYIGLFRPGKRSLTWDRVEKLLNELLEPIHAQKVNRKGRNWIVTVDIWQAGLDELLSKRDKLTLPMKSHGYLFEIVVGLADKQEAATEQKQEQEKQQRPKPGPQESGPTRIGEMDAWKRNMERLGRKDQIDQVEQSAGGNSDD